MVRSPLSDVDIPDDVPVHEVLFNCMQLYDDKVALVDGLTEKEYTYSELYTIIRRVASGLRRRGLQKGQILAILSPNNADFVIMFLATLACGAAVCTINHVYTAYEVTKHLQDSKARFIFSSQETVKTALQAAKQAHVQTPLIVSGGHPGCVAVSELQSDDGSMYPEDVVINPREDMAVIPYSSGTTGLPKGVIITHYNIVANLSQLGHPDLKLDPDVDPSEAPQDVCLAFLPFFHVYGMVGIMLGRLLVGNKLILMPRFIPDKFLQLIEKYKVNVLPLVPPVVVFMNKSPLVKKYDLSSLKLVNSGAAPLGKDTAREFKDRMGLDEMRQGYGMTETTLCCTTHLAKVVKSGSIGVPIPNCEMLVVDAETKKVLGPYERGEIWVKGPNIMKGYLNKPEATREALDEQGWLRTGDIAYYDDESFFFVVDRMKELIKYKGFQVAPAELEALILTHSGVADVAVIGVPDQEAGELPKAYVVKKPDQKLTEHDVIQFVAEHVSSFKHLRGGVEFIEVIPKSLTGKILRRELRDRGKQSKL